MRVLQVTCGNSFILVAVSFSPAIKYCNLWAVGWFPVGAVMDKAVVDVPVRGCGEDGQAFRMGEAMLACMCLDLGVSPRAANKPIYHRAS